MKLDRQPDDLSIDRPTLPVFHPERVQECEDAIAGAITKVMDDAENAGWTITEICMALTTLADSVMLDEVDIEQTNFLLKDLMSKG